MKTCARCSQTFPATNEYFYKLKRNKDGLRSECKECAKEYYRKNKEKTKEYCRKYYQENREKKKEYCRKYKKENKGKIKEYFKERRKKDPMYRMIMNQRRRTNIFYKQNNYRKNSSTIELIGCSPEQLRKHLRKQYQQGMTDENYGKWHIDHIIPLSSAKSQEELDKLCHYTNLQPLWAIDNIKKSSSIIT